MLSKDYTRNKKIVLKRTNLKAIESIFLPGLTNFLL